MTLNEMYNSFVACASNIEGFKAGQKEDVEYDIDILANGYVEASKNHDEEKMGQYISALMVRYWHMIPLLYETSKTLRVEMTDMVDWLYDALLKAFSYCSWLDESKPVSKTRKGAEKCINQCITSMRQWWFKNLNQDKRKVNAMTYSLDDDMPNSYGENDNITVLDTVRSDDSVSNEYGNELVQSFLDNNEIFNALILDGIINQDTLTKSMIAKHLRTLDDTFIDYFESNYDVSMKVLSDEISKIKSCDNRKLIREINKAMENIKENETVGEFVCC